MATKAKPISKLTLHSISTVEGLERACEEGKVEELEKYLDEEGTQDDKTALANRKSQETGFTPLHRVCHHGHSQCIPVLLKHHADPRIWDHCGLAPIHSAARSNNKQCVILLLESRKCQVNEKTGIGETPLLIACLYGSLDVARCLYEEYNSGVPEEDRNGNTILHYASASDSSELLLWLLSIHEFKALMECPNNEGYTPLHHACALGCTNSLSALLHHNVNVSSLSALTRLPLSHPPHFSPSQLTCQYGNRKCYEIIENSATPPPLPRVSTVPIFNNEGNQVSEDHLKESHSAALFVPQRSNSSGSRGSRQSLLSTSASVQRRGSLMGTSRPVTLELRRSSSLKRGSSETLIRRGEEERRAYIQSRSSATRLSRSLSRQSSSSVEQLLYDSTAYEPPPDIQFILPVVKKVLTSKTRKVYSSEHGLKLRVSQDYWTGDNKSHGLHIFMAAGMHYSQTFPQGYTVVSPICFISCRSRGRCRVILTLPHAINTSHDQDITSRLVILSSATAKPDSSDPQSPFFSPSERELEPLHVTDLRIEKGKVRFETELCHPSLFAVAVKDGPLLPLRCCLYVLSPVIEPSVTMVTGFDIESYVGMNLHTVATSMVSWSEANNLKLEEKNFIFSDEEVVVEASLLPSTQTDWEINNRGEGKFSYTQVSLTRYTDRDTYSHHQPVYPHRERFFIEPRAASSAVKCRVTVCDQNSELCHLLVIPYTPKKETTPDLSSEDHRHSISLNTEHPPPRRRHSLPPYFSSQGSYRASFHTPSHFPQVLLTRPSPSPPPPRLTSAVPGTSSLSSSTIRPSSAQTTNSFRPPSTGTSANSSSTSPSVSRYTPPPSSSSYTPPPPSTRFTPTPPPSSSRPTPPPSTPTPPPPSMRYTPTPPPSSSRPTPPPPTNGQSYPYPTQSPVLYLRLPNGEHHTESQV